MRYEAEGRGAEGVVAEAAVDCAEMFPARSYAATVYEYVVEGESAESEYVLVAEVAIWVPPRYILYPVTATLSV